MIIPDKLEENDEIRVIAPSRSASQEWLRGYLKAAEDGLTELGFKVSYGMHIYETDEFGSSPIPSRVSDLEEAFLDKNVKAILTVIGGFNSNQLLRYIDYEVIRKNPKILCGFSDITALSDAITAKTGVITYYGPHFLDFAVKEGNRYTIEYFKACLMSNQPFEIGPREYYSEDYNWKPVKNDGNFVINPGEAKGRIIGGNLCTFNLLQGTEYMPDISDSILFIEDDHQSDALTFDRDLQSLIHQPDFNKVRGLLIGRFQERSKVTRDLLSRIIRTKKELGGIPVIADVDFGHTFPRITLPIGGEAIVSARDNNGKISVLKH
jgi:muramoyltetrapeptide carboxypeptidase LdcA involved in peptidoglycan recycling